MHKLTILYGHADDPAAFREYYEQTHVPLARSMSQLIGWNLIWLDADPQQPSPYRLIAELITATKADMDAMLASEAGTAARDDLANFVTGTVTFLSGKVTEVALS